MIVEIKNDKYTKYNVSYTKLQKGDESVEDEIFELEDKLDYIRKNKLDLEKTITIAIRTNI